MGHSTDDGSDGVTTSRYGIHWEGMGWEGMGWDGMGWVGVYCAANSVRPTVRSLTARSCLSHRANLVISEEQDPEVVGQRDLKCQGAQSNKQQHMVADQHTEQRGGGCRNCDTSFCILIGA